MESQQNKSIYYNNPDLFIDRVYKEVGYKLWGPTKQEMQKHIKLDEKGMPYVYAGFTYIDVCEDGKTIHYLKKAHRDEVLHSIYFK